MIFDKSIGLLIIYLIDSVNIFILRMLCFNSLAWHFYAGIADLLSEIFYCFTELCVIAI